MPLQENLLYPRPAWFPDALAAIGRHGFLTARQLGAVTHVDPHDVAPALSALVAEGLLQTLMPTHGTGGRAVEPALVLTRMGRDLLRVVDERAPIATVHAAKSRYILAHDLLRNEFGLVLEALADQGLVVLHRFEAAREKIAAVARVPGQGAPERVPLVADALAVLAVAGVTTAFLVEVDRGTIGIERMRTKYRGYLAWARDQGPLRRFGLKSLRVLTVAPTAARLKRLREAALDATDGRGNGLFWFCPESAVDCLAPERLLEPIATVARTGDSLYERLFV
jgi:DNA-binding MarR family transcriptional regulator